MDEGDKTISAFLISGRLLASDGLAGWQKDFAARDARVMQGLCRQMQSPVNIGLQIQTDSDAFASPVIRPRWSFNEHSGHYALTDSSQQMFTLDI